MNRRESEQDDHGEEYPMYVGGPNIYFTLTIPAGLSYLSLYEFNKDGHSGTNRWRDYRVSIHPHYRSQSVEDIGWIAWEPEIAHGRVLEIWGGVWKRFLVRGPMELTIAVERNNSFNTILCGVMLDSVDEQPTPYFAPENEPPAPLTRNARQGVATRPEQHCALPVGLAKAHSRLKNMGRKRDMMGATAQKPHEIAGSLLSAINTLRQTDPIWWARNSRPCYLALLRWYRVFYDEAYPHPDTLLASRFGTCAYQCGLLPQWEECQRQRGLTTVRQVDKALRWDGVTDNMKEDQAIAQYLARHPVKKLSGRQSANRK